MTKKQFDFIGKRKLFLFISAAVLVIGLLINVFVLPTELDINFKGGAIFTYSFSGETDQPGIDQIATQYLGDEMTSAYSSDVGGETTQATFTLTQIPSTVLTYQVSGTADEDLLKTTGQTVFGCETRVDYDQDANQVKVDPVEVVSADKVDDYTAALSNVTATDVTATYTLLSSNTVSELADSIYGDLVAKYGSQLVYNIEADTVDIDDVTADIENALLGQAASQEDLMDVTLVLDETAGTLTVTPATGDLAMDENDAKVITKALQTSLPDAGITLKSATYNTITLVTSNSVKPTVGQGFFIKCLFAMVLGGLFLTLYIGIRFRKIGGFSAGVFATLALIHDILIAYLTYVIFQIPLNDNFIAVVLTILGYSINGTIVVYDRIRENEQKFGSSLTVNEIVNRSVNETVSRNIFTSLTTLVSVVAIAVIAKINGLDSILSFAFPMAVGLVAGFYSSVLLSSPLWAWWRTKRLAKQGKK